MKAHELRVVDEKQELDQKLALLDVFRKTETFKSLPDRDRSLLHQQASAMALYSFLLGERIATFTA